VTPLGRSAAVGAVALAVATSFTWGAHEGRDEAAGRRLDGRSLFYAKGCAACHDGPSSSVSGSEYPSLADAPVWAGSRRTGMSAEQYLAESMRAPSAFISPAYQPGDGRGMPVLPLDASEINSLVDYLLDR
jgi:hypothetical protein